MLQVWCWASGLEALVYALDFGVDYVFRFEVYGLGVLTVFGSSWRRASATSGLKVQCPVVKGP